MWCERRTHDVEQGDALAKASGVLMVNFEVMIQAAVATGSLAAELPQRRV